ncbi:MFS transporter [Paenibacillus sp. S150]|uniref:MFS transporter n=1 Tax=Paenibacillus sp. S150 TaxID=2749826 RepID=UPI001C583296|nr:MFS transporter [Paenibacillus sp. S150]MBW4079810.1 MFS transporter [Paenibacillus sp. S150]
MTHKNYPWHVLTVTSLGVLLVTLNLSTLTVALPELTAYFGASPLESNWILLSYMLFNAIFILIFGKMADIYGRRTLYLTGLTGFTIVSLLCGFATNVWVLIMLRVLQAAGGAIVITNTTPLLTDAFAEEKLGTALSFNVLNSSAAQLLGPVIGGFVVYALDWRWVFWFNVPVGIAGILWAVFVLRPVPGRAKGEKIDFIGNACILFGLGGIIYAFSEGGVNGWSSPSVLIGVLLFIGFGICFVWWERRVKHPSVDFSLFRDRAFAMANLANFLNSLARSSVALLIALFFQVMYKENTFSAGLQVLPVTVGMIAASLLVGFLTAKYSTLSLSTFGLVLSAGGMLLLALFTGADAATFGISLGQFLVGFGSGIFMTPNTKSIMLTVPPEKRGMANGLRSMLQNMGVVISTALSLMLVTSVLPESLKEAVYAGANAEVLPGDLPQIAGGFQLAFTVMAVLTGLAIAASYLRVGRQSGVNNTLRRSLK